MTIDMNSAADFSPPRKGVAWLGIEPPLGARSAWEDRGFFIFSGPDLQLDNPGFASTLAAVILTQWPGRPRRLLDEIDQHTAFLLDWGCHVVVQLATSALGSFPAGVKGHLDSRGLVSVGWDTILPQEPRSAISPNDGNPPFPFVSVYGEQVQWPKIANELMEHPPGPAPKAAVKLDLAVVDAGASSDLRNDLRADELILLQRAFWDCTEIRLEPLAGGRSDAQVFRAYAELSPTRGGVQYPWPVPYFVKIDDRDKIVQEYRNYADFGEPYIPFHLGPHLVLRRCCLGARKGIIVGDFVEGSECLSSSAPAGRGAAAISCLFDHTLDAWHRGYREEIRLSEQLEIPSEIAKSRIRRARQLGATRSAKAVSKLFEKGPKTPALCGSVHGDLHARNVRVRGEDAIVIDLASRKVGPLLTDPATLEASLLVDCFPESLRQPGGFDRWLEAISPLYLTNHFSIAPVPGNPKNEFAWFFACVRRIRHFAQRMELAPGQYAMILAAALLFKASKDEKAPDPEASVRAAAYRFGEHLAAANYRVLNRPRGAS